MNRIEELIQENIAIAKIEITIKEECGFKLIYTRDKGYSFEYSKEYIHPNELKWKLRQISKLIDEDSPNVAIKDD